jgi:hypothetical protein
MLSVSDEESRAAAAEAAAGTARSEAAELRSKLEAAQAGRYTYTLMS